MILPHEGGTPGTSVPVSQMQNLGLGGPVTHPSQVDGKGRGGGLCRAPEPGWVQEAVCWPTGFVPRAELQARAALDHSQ